jgi:enoyl-CoA hydratase
MLFGNGPSRNVGGLAASAPGEFVWLLQAVARDTTAIPLDQSGDVQSPRLRGCHLPVSRRARYQRSSATRLPVPPGLPPSRRRCRDVLSDAATFPGTGSCAKKWCIDGGTAAHWLAVRGASPQPVPPDRNRQRHQVHPGAGASVVSVSPLTLLVTRRGQCTILTLDRPRSLNAINEAMVDAIEVALDRLEGDASRAFVLTGSGRAFCVGSDLKEGTADADARVRRMHALILRIAEHPKLSVAALNGLTLGGGLELALACTFRVAAAPAMLGLPEIKLSLIPSYGATQLLPRLIGPARALEMMLSGDSLTAGQALEIGLVNAVGTDALTGACTLAERCAGHGLLAQQAIRHAVAHGTGEGLAAGLAIERDLVVRISESEDARAGLARFRAGHR